MCFVTQASGPFKTPLNIAVELFTMVPVIGERGVDLPEIQVRMLEVQFFRTPPISLLLDDQLYNLHRGSGEDGNVLLV
ncbi:hypothetical protein BH23ACT11_BH23ACT11_14490 [soil metagenome]